MLSDTQEGFLKPSAMPAIFIDIRLAAINAGKRPAAGRGRHMPCKKYKPAILATAESNIWFVQMDALENTDA